MKRTHLRALGVSLALSAVLTIPALGAEPLLQYNGQAIHAIRDGDTICVSFRELCEAAGYDVSWVNGTAVAKGAKTITANLNSGKLITSQGSSSSKIRLHSGRTILPVRHLAEALNLFVHYDAGTGTAMISTAPQSYSEEDLFWLSRIIHAEAGGEPMEGKLAVGNVVLNRVASKQFPNTIYDVIFDTKYAVQFEPTANGTVYNTPSKDSISAAKRVLAGENVIGNALYFYNPSLVDAVWIRTNCTYIKTIGCHDFFV